MRDLTGSALLRVAPLTQGLFYAPPCIVRRCECREPRRRRRVNAHLLEGLEERREDGQIRYGGSVVAEIGHTWCGLRAAGRRLIWMRMPCGCRVTDPQSCKIRLYIASIQPRLQLIASGPLSHSITSRGCTASWSSLRARQRRKTCAKHLACTVLLCRALGHDAQSRCNPELTKVKEMDVRSPERRKQHIVARSPAAQLMRPSAASLRMQAT